MYSKIQGRCNLYFQIKVSYFIKLVIVSCFLSSNFVLSYYLFPFESKIKLFKFMNIILWFCIILFFFFSMRFYCFLSSSFRLPIIFLWMMFWDFWVSMNSDTMNDVMSVLFFSCFFFFGLSSYFLLLPLFSGNFSLFSCFHIQYSSHQFSLSFLLLSHTRIRYFLRSQFRVDGFFFSGSLFFFSSLTLIYHNNRF